MTLDKPSFLEAPVYSTGQESLKVLLVLAFDELKSDSSQFIQAFTMASTTCWELGAGTQETADVVIAQ